MAKMTGLEDRLTPASGNDQTNGSPEETPTYRTLFKLVIGNSKARTADDSRRLTRAMRKFQATGDAELTDEEVKSVKELVETNQVNLSAWAQGQLLEKFEG